MPQHPRIGIYAGGGTSHSWLWFAEIFDHMNLRSLVFLEENAVRNGGMDDIDVLAVSGGDTFAVAAALGQEGAEKIKSFVEAGGIYIGSCAGAYLPMNSSKEPLNLFNFVDVKIANKSRTLPMADRMVCKYCIAYGDDYIFHPVREAVRLKTTNIAPFNGIQSLTAPMYGGPSMIASEKTEVLAYFEGFTDKTVFLGNKEQANETLIGKAAAVRQFRKDGCFYLFGPHFEHPHFPEANRLLIDVIHLHTNGKEYKIFPQIDTDVLAADKKKSLLRDIKRELSNSRIAATSIEFLPIQWQIGAKIYEPAKIRVFLESMWKRIRFLEKSPILKIKPGTAERMVHNAVQITALIRRIKNEAAQDTTESAKTLFDLLHRLSIDFLDMYFRNDE